MAEFPALPLWTDAYLGDTTHLTTIEHGAYLLLLMTAWRTAECCLPDDDRLLARFARMNAQQWKRIRPIIEAFFVIEGGLWRQRRLTDERDAVKRHRLLQSEKGKAGAQAKALKNKGRHKAGAKSGLASAQAQVQPDASSLTHTQEEKDEDKSSSQKTLIPENWEAPPIDDLPPRARALAEQWTADVYANETEAFVCYWRSERKMKADWRMTWANRIIDQHDRVMRRLNGSTYGNGSSQSSNNSIVDQVLAEKEREERRMQQHTTSAGGPC